MRAYIGMGTNPDTAHEFADVAPCFKDDDKKSLFWGRSIGDFGLCVKDEVDALCGRPSF
jgi:hypothetical protein